MRGLKTIPLLLVVGCLDLAGAVEGLSRAAGKPAWKPAADADRVPRVVVLGFDGVDPKILEEYVAAGVMPAMKALREKGGVHLLDSEIPPESPVAWASLLTGVNPGKHGILDFVVRDPETTGYRPVNGMATFEPPRFLFGSIPFRPARVTARLAYPTFLERVAAAGYRVLALRQPLLFPARDVPGASMLAGLGTPDLAKSNGLYAIYSAGLDLGSPYTVFDGHRIHLDGGPDATAYDTYLEGPFDPTTHAEGGGQSRITVPLRFERASRDGPVTIDVAGNRETLPAGGATTWIRVPFTVPSIPRITASGRVRFFVVGTDPLVVLCDPIQIDPLDPVLPISTPPDYAADLERRYGPYKTTGWMEQTFQLNDKSTTEEAFLKDLLQDMDHGRAVLMGELARGAKCVFYVFTQTDRASHCFFWRRDKGHPRYDAQEAARLPDPLKPVYERMDAIVGDVAARLGPDDLLLIASDHGFQTWRRGVNVNQWLMNNGYLESPGADEMKLPEWFAGRWMNPIVPSKTRAYALGLGQIYVNLKGREPGGIVEPKDVDALVAELKEKLLALRDVDGKAPLKDVIRLKDVYSGPKVSTCGELQLAFDVGYRVSWQTALLGGMRGGGPVFEDNFFAWSGDHCSTHRDLVRGVLLTNQPLPPAPAGRPYHVRDVAATVLQRFGIAAHDLEGESVPLPLPPVRLAPPAPAGIASPAGR